MSNIVRMRVTIKGTRTLLQHHFGPDAIPTDGKRVEREGAAGNNPGEWKKTCMLTEERQLYLPGTYIFGCLRNGAVHTKKGRGSLQSTIVSTLQIEEDMILLNRSAPEEDELTKETTLTPINPEILTFIYVSGVRNPATKARNVRYRLATRAGWKCSFTVCFDKTVLTRNQMEAILRDSGTLGGLGDGIKIGCGRFDVISCKEIEETEEQEDETEEEETHATNGREKKRKQTAKADSEVNVVGFSRVWLGKVCSGWVR